MLNSASTLLEIISKALFAVRRTSGRYIDKPEQQMGEEKGSGVRYGSTFHLTELVGFHCRFFLSQKSVMHGYMLVKI